MLISICTLDVKKVNGIELFINKYFLDKAYSYKIIHHKSSKALLDDLKDGMHFNIIFLDSYDNVPFGMNVAKTLRELNYTGSIVVMLDSVQFALDSYDMQDFDYVINPFNVDKIGFIMNSFVKKFHKKSYIVKRYSNIISIPYDEILYIESVNCKCTLHRNNGDVYNILYKHLDDIEEEIHDKRFLRCHQSYLVNMNYINSVDKSFVLTNGDLVQIRQRYLRSIKEVYFQYLLIKIKKQ